MILQNRLLKYGHFKITSPTKIFLISLLVLAFFNLIPIPPLDGSKILLNLLPTHLYEKTLMIMQRWGLALVIIFVFLLWTPLFNLLMRFIISVTGVSFF